MFSFSSSFPTQGVRPQILQQGKEEETGEEMPPKTLTSRGKQWRFVAAVECTALLGLGVLCYLAKVQMDASEEKNKKYQKLIGAYEKENDEHRNTCDTLGMELETYRQALNKIQQNHNNQGMKKLLDQAPLNPFYSLVRSSVRDEDEEQRKKYMQWLDRVATLEIT